MPGTMTESCESPAPSAPFLKWAGGKGRMLSMLKGLLPSGVEVLRHVEPFAGSASLFFGLEARRALLADVNDKLIGTYISVRDELSSVLAHLEELEARHSSRFFYDVRERFNRRLGACAAERAAWFIYLNKTCFNGLYRVNRRGEFNVPFGRYARPRIVDRLRLESARARLQTIELRSASFEETLADVGAGDFVYLDPPYVGTSATANFTSYSRAGFGAAQHEALAALFNELDRRGARVMASNSDTPLVRALYREWPQHSVQVRRSVSCAIGNRGEAAELIITNYVTAHRAACRSTPPLAAPTSSRTAGGSHS